MKACVLTPDGPEWRDALARLAHDFYHLPGYLALSAQSEGARAIAVRVDDGDETLFLPLLVREIAGRTELDASSPYGYPGPLATSANAFATCAPALVEALRREGVIAAFVRMHPLLSPATVPVGTLVEHGPTVVVDLHDDEERMWAQTMSGHRNEIRKAERAGQRVVFDDFDRHYEPFRRAYAETMQRVGARPFYFFDDDYFARLRDALGERLHLLVVELGGEPIGGALFTHVGDIVQYHLSATRDAFLRERPNKIMLHQARLWAKARGARWLHLGGGRGGAQDSLFQFKAGFSSGRATFRSWRVVSDPERFATACREVAGSDVVLDDPATFPAYRFARPPATVE